MFILVIIANSYSTYCEALMKATLRGVCLVTYAVKVHLLAVKVHLLAVKVHLLSAFNLLVSRVHLLAVKAHLLIVRVHFACKL